MAAHIIMDSAFQKLTTYGDIQRGISMLRILLADDDSVFLSKMERLLTQYADRQQLNIQIGTYSRDDLNNYLLKPYDIAFLDIDFGSRRGAGIDLARRLRQEGLTQSSFSSRILSSTRRRDTSCARSAIF